MTTQSPAPRRQQTTTGSRSSDTKTVTQNGRSVAPRFVAFSRGSGTPSRLLHHAGSPLTRTPPATAPYGPRNRSTTRNYHHSMAKKASLSTTKLVSFALQSGQSQALTSSRSFLPNSGFTFSLSSPALASTFIIQPPLSLPISRTMSLKPTLPSTRSSRVAAFRVNGLDSPTTTWSGARSTLPDGVLSLPILPSMFATPPSTPSRRSSIMPDSRMKKLPALPPGESPAAPTPNFRQLYQARMELDRRWDGLADDHWVPRSMALSGHSDSVYCLEFSRTHIITGSRDRSVKVWSLTSGKLLGTFKGQHRGSILCLKFELDEIDPETGGLRGFLVTGSSDCNVCVWDLWTERAGEDAPVFGEVKAVLRGHGGGVLDLRIDERWIVSCAKDAAIRVWSREQLELHRTLRGHEGPVNAVGLQSGTYAGDGARHGGRVVSASGDGKMILWDIESGQRVRTFEGHDRGLACIEFKGDLIISGSNDCKIKIWSASSGACLRTLVGHEALVRALSCDPQSGRLVSASYDRSVRVWDLGTGRAIRVVRDSHTSHIFDVKFDSRRIVSTSHDRKIVILDFSASLGVDPALLG
ncbi:WD40 repeat-like protein [Mycena kentingensis (nom. inval.)]|nr:WD40 repeat-like protein [Mycena kentingensis (nom. inval.)]